MLLKTLTTEHHNANWSPTRTDNVESEAGPVLYVVFEVRKSLRFEP